MQNLLNIFEQVDVVAHNDEIAHVAAGSASHVAVLVCH